MDTFRKQLDEVIVYTKLLKVVESADFVWYLAQPIVANVYLSEVPTFKLASRKHFKV